MLCEDIPLGNPLDLAFAEHVHGFITLDGPLRRGKCSTPQPRIHAAFHKPMILFWGIFGLREISPNNKAVFFLTAYTTKSWKMSL